MKRCTVIGSGPSGIHFARAALSRGYAVEMIDVGYSPPASINPDDSFSGLKSRLEDPADYLLGPDFEGVLLPGEDEEFYGIPPSKAYALRQVPWLDTRSREFAPMFSFAQGGLAEMWTGGSYPFNDAELSGFPFDYAALAPYYAEVAGNIGINGVADDLAAFLPVHDNLQEPLRLDEHSARLLARYAGLRDYFRDRLGCHLGRSRLAVLSRDQGDRQACQYSGRCIWGCPRGALYIPSLTLDECRRSPHFTYHGGFYVTHFGYGDDGRVRSVSARQLDGGAAQEFPVDTLVLACGALGTSRIYLESIYRQTGEVRELHGLMDNRQVLMPFLNPGMIGRQYHADSYQYNQLAMGLEDDSPEAYVHCMITTLKTAMVHPVIDRFPLDLRTGVHMFRNIHAALGVINVNFHDTRRDDCTITLDVGNGSREPQLAMNYVPPPGEDNRIARTVKRLKKVLRKLGCIVPPGMVHTRPMGASVHYAGTLPMSVEARPMTVSPDCRSHDFSNLLIADGATFPFLPAKNITFTLMANACRIADGLDR
jgi:choline dehydrogenase-like flavoprotein